MTLNYILNTCVDELILFESKGCEAVRVANDDRFARRSRRRPCHSKLQCRVRRGARLSQQRVLKHRFGREFRQTLRDVVFVVEA